MKYKVNYSKFKREEDEGSSVYPNRKSDMETETMRIWKCGKDDKDYKDREKDIKEDKGYYELNFRGVKIMLGGFYVCSSKEGFKFCCKFKHEAKQVLYYINEDLPEDEQSKIKEIFLRGISELGDKFFPNYEITNIRDNLIQTAIMYEKEVKNKEGGNKSGREIKTKSKRSR